MIKSVVLRSLIKETRRCLKYINKNVNVILHTLRGSILSFWKLCSSCVLCELKWAHLWNLLFYGVGDNKTKHCSNSEHKTEFTKVLHQKKLNAQNWSKWKTNLVTFLAEQNNQNSMWFERGKTFVSK